MRFIPLFHSKDLSVSPPILSSLKNAPSLSLSQSLKKRTNSRWFSASSLMALLLLFFVVMAEQRRLRIARILVQRWRSRAACGELEELINGGKVKLVDPNVVSNPNEYQNLAKSMAEHNEVLLLPSYPLDARDILLEGS
ncbi:hypothetical protein Sjap_024787 [Stephania japonica]|uniref:Uncharacterized protein n=1 Tax=Stephania japonica TaxID=461633 RepID=A0AAP0EG75_9MAGN